MNVKDQWLQLIIYRLSPHFFTKLYVTLNNKAVAVLGFSLHHIQLKPQQVVFGIQINLGLHLVLVSIFLLIHPSII